LNESVNAAKSSHDENQLMKYSKATLKLNINVRKAIQLATLEVDGLQRIDYSVDWSNFPNSLNMNATLAQEPCANNTLSAEETDAINKIIQRCFLKFGIKFRDIRKNISLQINQN